MRSKRLALSAVLGGLLLLTAPSAFAAKGGNGAGGGKIESASTIALVLVDSTDGVPHWNQQVRFDVSTTATPQPHLDLSCRQAGAVVYFAQTGYFDGYPWPWTQTMTLSSGAWTGGDADCTATLYRLANDGRRRTLATLDFHVVA